MVKIVPVIIFVLLFFYLLIQSSCELWPDDGEEGYTVIDSVQIYMMDITGKNLMRITDGENPVYVPDTNKILYRLYDKIYTISMNGTDKQFVANADGLDMNMFYKMTSSYDGAYVAFPAREKGVYDIFIATLDGETVLNLTNSDDRWEDNPIFSADGNSLFFCEFVYISSTVHQVKSIGISSIDLLGNRYKNIIQDSTGFELIGITSDNKTVFARKYDSSKGTDLYIINNDNPFDYKKVFFQNDNCRFSSTISDDNILYFNKNESGIYSFNLTTEEIILIYDGPVERDYVLSNNIEKLLKNSDRSGLEIIDLNTGESITVLSEWDADLRDLSFSPDDLPVQLPP